MNNQTANHPAAGNAAFAPQLAIESHWRGLPEPGRWVELSDIDQWHKMKYRFLRPHSA
jgi:hypothetical protein